MVSDLGPVLVRLLRQPLLDRQHLVVQHHLVAAGCDDKLNLCILDFVDGVRGHVHLSVLALGETSQDAVRSEENLPTGWMKSRGTKYLGAHSPKT